MVKKINEKVLLLALSDDFWTPFVVDMVDKLASQGIEVVVAADSRVGEYQSFGRRISYGCTVYYFSEYQLNNKDNICFQNENISLDNDVLFSDYYRLYCYEAHIKLKKMNWNFLKKSLFAFFKHIFDSERIGIVLHDQVSTSFSYVCYSLAKIRGIEYFGLVGARVPGRYEIRKSIYNESDAVLNIFQDIITNRCPVTIEEQEWARNFIKDIDDKVPSYMVGNFLCSVCFSAYINRSKLISFLRKFKYEIMENESRYMSGFKEPPLIASIRSVKRNLRRLVRRRSLDANEARIDENWLVENKFWLYPVHYQPEASTSIGSPYFVDQFDFIRNVAFSLPDNTFLIVKEHQAAIGYHYSNFYRDVANIPNVLLLGVNWNIKDLIRWSQGVITLTSTAGFEALLLGKSVYMFGDAFYSFHPRCKTIKSWDELRLVVRNSNNNGVTCSSEDFLVAYRRYTREGAINYSKNAWDIGDDLLRILVKTLNHRVEIG